MSKEIKRESFEEYDTDCMYHPKRGCVHLAENGKFTSSLVRNENTRNELHAPALDIDFSVTKRKLAEGKTLVEIHGPNPTHAATEKLFRVLVTHGLIASQNGLQFPAVAPDHREPLPPITFIVPLRLISSSSGKHFHFYLDKVMSWEQYRELLVALRDAEVIGIDFYSMCVQWKVSFLLKPGISKSDLKVKV